MAKARGIYKRGSVYWIRYTSIDGKQKKESTHSNRKQDAELLHAQRIQAVRQGQEPPEIKRYRMYHLESYQIGIYHGFRVGKTLPR